MSLRTRTSPQRILTPSRLFEPIASFSSFRPDTENAKSLIVCRSIRKETPETEKFISDLRSGLEAGNYPVLIEQGEGGTYRMMGRNKEAIGIFKPSDEESTAEHNPKKHADSPQRKGIIPGEGALREVAAYLLDHGSAGVPLTTLIEINHPALGGYLKTGSVQRWIGASESADNLSSSLFSVADVHRIGILDIRLLNTDRHDGNILAVPDSKKLIPIDHGFVLPAQLGETYFAWLHWKQAKAPFDSTTLEYIANLDIESDTKTLRKLGMQAECIGNFRMATILLKKAAAAGLTLFEIANLVCRNENDDPSALEVLYEDAMDASISRFWPEFEARVDALLSLRKRSKSVIDDGSRIKLRDSILKEKDSAIMVNNSAFLTDGPAPFRRTPSLSEALFAAV